MAAVQNFSVDQGTSVKVNFTVKQLTNPNLAYNVITNPYIAINLSGSSIAMMGRLTYNSSSPLVNWSTTNGKIVITSAVNGLFSLVLLPADTTTVLFKDDSVDLVYDIEITDVLLAVTRAFQGTITLSREVTR